MTITKGTTLYDTASGRAHKVVSVRKSRRGDAYRKITLDNDVTFDQCITAETLDSNWWTLEQTPALARLWAKTLQEREDERTKWAQKVEDARLLRVANRERLNAPPRISLPAVGEDEVRLSITTTEVHRKTDEVADHISEVRVSVYQTTKRLVDEQGEFVYVPVWNVNWSALGTQSPAVARAYALAILAAADLADERNATKPCQECDGASEIQYDDRGPYEPCRTCNATPAETLTDA